jgi:hypothetical protein
MGTLRWQKKKDALIDILINSCGEADENIGKEQKRQLDN